MKIKFGVMLGNQSTLPRPEDLRAMGDLVSLCEDFGAAAIGTYDTSFIGGDAFVRATLLAERARSARVGLRPTNPLTREPQVMAGFAASLDSLTAGRAFLDVASGDSAVYNIGLKPASRARIEAYVRCVRELLANGESDYDGRPQRIRWHRDAVRPRVPISICAEGPRMLHLAGRIADGVIAGTGLTADVVSDTIRRVHGGAQAEGRSPDEVEIWFTTRTALDLDRNKAIDEVRGSVSSILNHSMRFGLEGKNLPEALIPKVQEYVDGYVLYEHVQNHGENPRRMEALGLTDYAMQRFALAGDPNDWIARIESLVECGVQGIWIGPGAHPIERQMHDMRLFAERIAPHFQ
ncbi:MAG: LLM class flavin-dependent oxidoreductase [Gammaproteobacteria bacterium]|nr:LLM class flavin-dependent oxidoreductase [Gammaproteobacteria bacterium]